MKQTFEEYDKIEELVGQHEVCWEVVPEYHMNQKGERVQIGFELDLIGTHYHPEQSPIPGCKECVNVYEDLKQIAQCIMLCPKRNAIAYMKSDLLMYRSTKLLSEDLEKT